MKKSKVYYLFFKFLFLIVFVSLELKIEIETKNESIDTLEKLVATKVRELNQKAEEVRGEEMDKLAKLTHEK